MIKCCSVEANVGHKGTEVVVSELERKQLLWMSRSRSLPHSLVRRAKIVLMAAAGHTNQEIALQCEVTSPAITHWKKRFVAQGFPGLHDEARPGRPRAHDDEAVAKLPAKVLHEKPDGVTHSSVRSAAAERARTMSGEWVARQSSIAANSRRLRLILRHHVKTRTRRHAEFGERLHWELAALS
ncbi:hypothetical protein BCh11DRAFT_08062 [Burkholderia sp. Ch1-1]|nr:hypothetical protein BCh11DRAFT_08062 [Burkholderia sp. Ch1-1]